MASDQQQADEIRPIDPLELRIDDAHPMRRDGDEERAPQASVLNAPQFAAVGTGAELSAGLAPLPLEGQQLDGLQEGRRPKLVGSPQVLAQHAADLAERLQTQLSEVDRRESRLNSQEAEFDSRIRNARLWIEEREGVLSERDQQLAEQAESLQQEREAAEETLSAAAGLAERLAEVEAREQAATRVQLELEIALTEQQTKNDALDFQRATSRTREEESEAARKQCEQRQRDLDEREAALYVEQERHSEQRLAFDRLQEDHQIRESNLTKREAMLAETEEKLCERASELEFERAELNRKIDQQQANSRDFEERKSRLLVRQREIETALERFHRLGVVEECMDDLQQQAEEFAQRSKYLDNAESLLAEQQKKNSEDQRAIEQQRLEFENQIVRERRTLNRENEARQREQDARAADLARREAELDKHQLACDQLTSELRDAQREALEMRLATEETWQQLQGVLAPATLSRSISMVRARIADHYKLAAEEVSQQRRQLEAVRCDLGEQHDRLSERSRELQRWSHMREKDLEEQAARLVAREQELSEQAREFQRREQQWQADRSEQQQETQQLLAALRRNQLPAAA
ncbi:coiled-coil domain-containing protein [Adhaeretor mobilis]|uniref:Uncharacterized protein n=1 Tax=Adhaeretor mobilis TaxID=1930276 RepID=A0A517MTX8_9BACT|nr:hypothetical protein [Adhaeretor mobilis]QDS98334.1 hypothetical protein HG15A2_16070 [Adhaeretor mobilis]